jgi:hypothetical protein
LPPVGVALVGAVLLLISDQKGDYDVW